MRARKHRNGYWLWLLAAFTLVLPAQPIVLASAAGTATSKAVTAPHRAAPVVTTPSVTLRVKSARDSLAYSATANPSAAQKLDPIPDFRKQANGQALKPNAPKDLKWLVNLDNTGNPGGGKDSAACHPSTNPNYPLGCSWSSVKYAVASPAISEGTWSDWHAADPSQGIAAPPAGTWSASPRTGTRWAAPTSASPPPHRASSTFS